VVFVRTSVTSAASLSEVEKSKADARMCCDRRMSVLTVADNRLLRTADARILRISRPTEAE
jgi:hypothetical protein